MKKIIYFLLLVTLIFIAGCSTNPSPTTETHVETSGEPTKIETSSWVDVEIKDVNSQENYKISDFLGTPVLVESFAVWCPTCTRQQNEIKSLHEEVGDSVISISLDTDPNEDEDQVLEHTNRNGFNWRYSIAPKELTTSLIEEFGNQVINAPSAPVILICEDGSRRLLERGVKSPEKLKEHINSC